MTLELKMPKNGKIASIPPEPSEKAAVIYADQVSNATEELNLNEFDLSSSFAEKIIADGIDAEALWDADSDQSGEGERDIFAMDDATAVEIIGDFETKDHEIDLLAVHTLSEVVDHQPTSSSNSAVTSMSSEYSGLDAGAKSTKVDGEITGHHTGVESEIFKILFDEDTNGSDNGVA